MFYLIRLSQKLIKLSNAFLASITAAFVLVSATIMYALEPKTFETWFNALWYVLYK